MELMKKALSAYFVMAMLTLKICAVGESAANLATQAVVVHEHLVAEEQQLIAESVVAAEEEIDKKEIVVKISSDKKSMNGYELAITIACLGAVAFLLPTFMVMCKNFMPEHRLQNYRDQQALEYEQARDNFQKCLWQADANAAKGFMQCPVACEKLARQLAGLGGKSDVRDMVQQFDAENR